MKTRIAILILALASLACLETTIAGPAGPTDSAPSAVSTPPLTTGDTPEPPEPDSGAVFEPAAFHTPETICATVTANRSLHLRAEPSEKGRVITWLYAGQVVKVKVRTGDWWYIEAEGRTGFAKADYLKESECTP